MSSGSGSYLSSGVQVFSLTTREAGAWRGVALPTVTHMQGQSTGWPPTPLFLRPGHSRHGALPTTAGPQGLVLGLPPEVSYQVTLVSGTEALSPRSTQPGHQQPWLGFRACRTRAAPALPEGSMSVPAPSGAGWVSRQACREQQPPLCTLGLRVSCRRKGST